MTADDAGGVVSSPLAIAVPLWTSAGRMVGALVVCASNVRHAPRREAEEAVAALEALAVRLGRAMENAELANRSLRAEKLASLGLLAGGIAHELSNPLVSVMGYGELIGAAAEEERVRGDATKIVEQAQRMRDIVENLVNFWRPPVWREEPVDMRALVRRLGEECQGNLAARGIMLEVRAAEDTPMLRGNEHRLRVVLEHLMNNAAQAIAAARSQVGDFRGEAAGDEKKVERREAIRLTVSYDPRAVHVIVSDTGAGFREPERVFDLFYTTQAPGEGSGLGLSICYGIVRDTRGRSMRSICIRRGRLWWWSCPMAR